MGKKIETIATGGISVKYLFATVFAGVMCTVAPSWAAACFRVVERRHFALSKPCRTGRACSWSFKFEFESGIGEILTRTRISNSNLRLQLNLVNLVNPV